MLRVIAALGGKAIYGLAMVKSSGGKLNRGVIYVTLGRMEEEGMLTSVEESSTPDHISIPRRLYSLTPFGRVLAEAIEMHDRDHDGGGHRHLSFAPA